MVDPQKVIEALQQKILVNQDGEVILQNVGSSLLSLEDVSNVDITLMTLRKPTELGKVIESVSKPARAVPKNGLPLWYKLGLECKLPVPKMPEGKIIFSRGRIGEDVRRIGLGPDYPRPTFDLTDPYCNTTAYDYVPMHDPHLAHYFSQKPARERMKQLGFVTKDNRAVCSLREFNLYRMYLYNRFMDRIHMEMKKLDERARDDLVLKRVDADVARRAVHFTKAEKARELMEKHARVNADEIAEKIRRAKEQEKKLKDRMKYLTEFNEKQRAERALKAREKENRIKQRVQLAAEMELRRKITMLRQWRQNEARRQARVKLEKEAKERKKEEESQRKWDARVEAQNYKLQKEALLLKLYAEDMMAGAKRRIKKADVTSYNNDLQLQRIRLENWKAMHGGAIKAAALVKKMGREFEKSKRGAKGMSPELAQEMAKEAMSTAVSTGGDALMTLAQARARMDIETILPTPPVKLLDEMLETAVVEFARRRVHLLLRDVEKSVHNKAQQVFFKTARKSSVSGARRSSKAPRFSIQLTTALAKQYVDVRGPSIAFAGAVDTIPPEASIEGVLKAARDRTPTPVPSMTKLAEVTFADKVEDLPDPVTLATYMPERSKLLENVNTAAKILARSVSQRVQKGMDLTVLKVTLPRIRNRIEWGEAVECMADAVVNNRVSIESTEIRRTTEFLAMRILQALSDQMKVEKARRRTTALTIDQLPAQEEKPSEPEPEPFEDPDAQQPFYVPGQVTEPAAPATPAGPGTTETKTISYAEDHARKV